MGIVVGTVVGMVVGTVVGWDWIVVVLGGRCEAGMPRLSWCLSLETKTRRGWLCGHGKICCWDGC